MTYEIEIIEPKAKKLLEELVNLKLIKFVNRKNKVEKIVIDDIPTKAEILAGIAESVRDVNAAMRGEKRLPNIWDALDNLDKEIESERDSVSDEELEALLKDIDE